MTVSINITDIEISFRDWDIFQYVANILNLALKKEKVTENKAHINIFFHFKGLKDAITQKQSKNFYLLDVFEDISSYDITSSNRDRVHLIYKKVKQELPLLFSREEWGTIDFSVLDTYFEQEVHALDSKIKAKYKMILVYVYHYNRVEHFMETAGKRIKIIETKNYLAGPVTNLYNEVEFQDSNTFYIKSLSGNFGWKVDLVGDSVQTVFFCKKELYKPVYNEYMTFTLNRYLTDEERQNAVLGSIIDFEEDPVFLSKVMFKS